MRHDMNGRDAALAIAISLLTPGVADAYIGPGAGITVIGTAVAFVGAVIFAIVGFIWYPLKRLRAALRGPQPEDGDEKASIS